MSQQAIPRLSDAASRQLIETALDQSLIVEASAGTGKTTQLIRRIVNVLRSGRARVPGIVAVTFTNKAAGEMKLRLRQELDTARQQAEGEEARNLEDALERLEEAAIGTIHAFCAQILRERPVEAQVDPAFHESSEPESRRLYKRVFRSWIQRKLDEDSPGLKRALSRLAWRERQPDDWGALDSLEQAGWQLIAWRDFRAAWEVPEFARSAEIDRLVGTVLDCSGRFNQKHREVHKFAEYIRRSEELQDRDYDTIEALIVRLNRDLKRKRSKGTEALIVELDTFQRRADAHLAVTLRSELWELVEKYESSKRQAGMLDYHDLLMMTRDLVRDNREVRAYLQQRYSHLFVDEFQDTDPLQAEILILLSAEDSSGNDWQTARPKDGKLFVVGDPKQSIYKFRRADVSLYESLKARLISQDVGLAYLTKSYRAVRPIQHLVNAAFEPEMQGGDDGAQALYAPLEEQAPAILNQPAVVALPAPRPYGKQRVSNQSIDACLPETIAAFTAWLIHESGWQVRDQRNSGELTPIRARDICLLFRRMINFGQDISREYARQFEARNIPHLLVGSKSFHEREEVETLRMALTAIEWPEDELAVFAALKGSLFAIPDALLLRYRTEVGRLHPIPAVRAADTSAEFEPVQSALRTLGSLHRRRNRRSVADTINLLLEAVRAHAGFALRPAGQQVLANVNRVCDLARSYEVAGGISFRGFVDTLEEEAERAESQEAPVPEESVDGVRLMTVHKAKGLEFPVVILADMTANLSRLEPERFVDPARGLCAQQLLWCTPSELQARQTVEKRREDAEGVRVAYVAATRARDLLVVPAVGDEERNGWLSPLNKAVYPAADRYRRQVPAAGCPRFGDASVLDRPYPASEEFSVCPGEHVPRSGEHTVVWWDPAALKLGVKLEQGPFQEEFLGDGLGDSRIEYRTWQQQREFAITAGEQPEFTVARISEVRDGPTGDRPVLLELVDRPIGRVGGRRFGTLVHALLRDIPLDAEQPRIAEMARLHARLLGATEAEIESAVETAAAALKHPLLQRARKASRCERELPVILDAGGQLLEGVADLAFLEPAGWQVVDFKTGDDFGSRRAQYEAQVRWYAEALERLTGQPAHAVLLAL